MGKNRSNYNKFNENVLPNAAFFANTKDVFSTVSVYYVCLFVCFCVLLVANCNTGKWKLNLNNPDSM